MRKGLLGVTALVLLLGAGAGGTLYYRADNPTTPVASPTRSAAPQPVRAPILQPAVATAPVPTGAGLARALTAALRAPGLGTKVGMSVLDALSGEALLEIGASRPVTPASTAKIATAVAALKVLRPEQVFTTTVTQGAAGDVVLVGAGDPTLGGRFAQVGYPSVARLSNLAAQLKGVVVKRVVVDDRLFAGARLGPGWKPGYVSDGDVAPVSALEVDEGRTSRAKSSPRSSDPALEAGRQLAALLKVRTVVRGASPAGAAVLAHVDSPTVAQLVESMLTRSDNDLAEALSRHVALSMRMAATFAGASAAVHIALGSILDDARVDRSALQLRDGSGLSPLDRLEPAALTRLLAVVGADQRYGPLLSGLPVAGFDGTLAKRYRTAPTSTAAGEVRAKTGTLNGVSALAGLVRTKDGRLLAFDLTADGVPLTGNLKAQAALDRVAAVLASCGCT
ncbi:MAG: D-alanyl-D-alaninecarboxypeptidase/D-alanyl-D-alanine-endopeptidase [Frankiales bacterium]|nr:D-alanyl-D-alaninecarboxypeptidase/D-alanyl-D-alanine-endopeptidase [Frankiales bacterium]